ncbi:hypothetical protein LCGC14_0445160 [marine sediment metagenome]|uniref:Large polyvalent protein associated domain-containing protein n=1 Tax=marine sediment metagenome TaxID=412755 RepID=A0A0F9SQ51_9ZZZZ
MAHTLTRSLFDKLRQRDDEERRAREVRQQAGFFRRFGRQDNAIGRAAGELFPLGLNYERARLEDPSLRPKKFVLGLQEMAFRGELTEPSPGMEQRGVPPPDLAFGPTTAEEAFAVFQTGQAVGQENLSPEENERFQQMIQDEASLRQAVQQQAAGAEFEQRGLEEAVRERQQGLPTISPETGLLQPALPLGAQPILADVRRQVELGGLAPEEAQEAFESQLNELQRGNVQAQPGLLTIPEEDLGFLGPAAGPVSREISAVTSPFGIAAIGAAPFLLGPRLAAAELGVGSAGALGLGTAGEVAGVPEPVQIGLEVGGGLLPAGALGAAATRIPGRVPREAAGEVDILTRLQEPRLTGETTVARPAAEAARPAAREGAEVAEAVAADPVEALLRGREAEAKAALAAKEAGPPPGPAPVVEKVTDIIKRAKLLGPEQEALRTQELGRRAGALEEAARATTGRARLPAMLAQMKGELPRLRFEAPERVLSIGEQDELADIVEGFFVARPARGALDRLPATIGLETALKGGIPADHQIAVLEEIFGEGFVNAIQRKRPLTPKLFDELGEGLNIPRTLLASTDHSMPLRQSAILTMDPTLARETSAAMKASIEAGGSTRIARELDDAMRATEEFVWLEEAGTEFVNFGGRGTAATRVEGFMAGEKTYIGRLLRTVVPTIRPSERMAATYQNQLRLTVGTKWRRSMESAGTMTPQAKRDLGELINVLTGRASIPQALEKWSPILNGLMFSVKLNLARVKTPFMLFDPRTPAAVRKIAARELATFLAMGTGIMMAVKHGGLADVETDPRSTDVMKIKSGPSRLDFWGGFQPYYRFIAQAVTGERKTATGEIQDVDLMDATVRFAQGKAAPNVGAALDIWRGETMIGEEVPMTWAGLGSEAQRKLVPLFVQDVIDAYKEQGISGIPLAAPGFFGVNVQSYTPFNVKMEQIIANDLLEGTLQGEYDPVPKRMGELDNSDQEIFEKAHPDLMEELARFQERGFAKGEPRSVFSEVLEQGRTILTDELDRIQDKGRAGGYGDMSERENISTFWDAIRQKESEKAGIFPAVELTWPDVVAQMREREPFSEPQRLEAAFFDLQDRHPNRETDEEWDAYEQDRARTFTDAQWKQIQTERAVGQHDLQRQHDFLTTVITDSEYYDVPEGRGQSRQRERMRRQSPALDAALFLLGRIATLKTAKARSIVQRDSQEIWGTAATPAPTGPFSPLQPGGFEPLQPGGFESLQPLGVP